MSKWYYISNTVSQISEIPLSPRIKVYGAMNLPRPATKALAGASPNPPFIIQHKSAFCHQHLRDILPGETLKPEVFIHPLALVYWPWVKGFDYIIYGLIYLPTPVSKRNLVLIGPENKNSTR